MKARLTQKQLNYLSWEFGVFFHFGIRTFYEGYNDWDGKQMQAEAFAPTALDCKRWMSQIKQAGARYAILTAKHHDGFANWPTKYSDFSIAQSPYKSGKGDVVREFVDACRAYDIKVGLYYSPAEPGMQTKTAKEYDDYFIGQISELLTGYGEIDYLWFDGCGSGDHEYDAKRIVGEIRRMQPGIMLFGMWDPDVRWVGNEAGYADEANYLADALVDYTGFDTDRKKWFHVPECIPAECDCMMRRRRWFYDEASAGDIKDLPELMGLYYGSVGRGSNLLINIGPDRRGLLPDNEANALIAMGQEVKRRFECPLAQVGNPDIKDNCFAVELPKPELVNTLVLEEALEQGEGVGAFRIRAKSYPTGTYYTVYHGKSMGHKKICAFPAVFTNHLVVEITEQFGPPAVKEAKAFFVN